MNPDLSTLEVLRVLQPGNNGRDIVMGATKKGEMYRTAEMLVDIAQEQGVYYAFALYYDSGRHSTADLKMLLDILQNTRGSIKEQ